MRRNIKRLQPPVYSIYAIYDNDIENRIYKVSFCHLDQLPQIERYYMNNPQRNIELIFNYFSLRFTHTSIETYLQDMDEKLNPVIIHNYTKEGNRKRIKQAKQPAVYNLPASVYTRNGYISDRKLLDFLFESALNEPYTIELLQNEYQDDHGEILDPDFIPADFWNYGLTIDDLPQDLQKKYLINYSD